MRARVLWGALAIVLALIAFVTASAIVYRLLFALLAVPLIGYVGGVLSARLVAGEVRRITPFLQVGGTMEEQITLRNLHWFPKLLIEAEHRTSPFGAGGQLEDGVATRELGALFDAIGGKLDGEAHEFLGSDAESGRTAKPTSFPPGPAPT